MEYEKIRPAVLSDRGGVGVACALWLDALSELLRVVAGLGRGFGVDQARSGTPALVRGLICGEDRGRRRKRARTAGLVTCLHGRLFLQG